MKVIIKEPHKAPELIDVNGYEEIREKLHGNICSWSSFFREQNISFICHDIWDENTPLNFLLFNQLIRGTAFFVGSKGDSYVSLNNRQINFIMSQFHQI